MSDPFESLARPEEPVDPRPAFARTLRARLADELGLGPAADPTDLPTIDLPDRRNTMNDPTDRPAPTGGIWAGVNSEDAPRMIRFLVDVLGFTEQLVVPGDEPGVVVHSQLVWPEGGTVQVGTAHRPDNEFSETPVGGQSLYVITADPWAVHARCVAAGVEVIREPESPDYDPDGMGFAIRDHEGNLWSFGTYDGS